MSWLLNLLRKIMQLITTDRVTEDTNPLERKIVYRGSVTVLDSDPDAVISYPYNTHTKTIVLPQFSTANTTYDVDVAYAGIQSGSYSYSPSSPAITSFGTFSQESMTTKISSSNGKLKIIFSLYTTAILDGLDPQLIFYYIVYANKITDEVIL